MLVMADAGRGETCLEHPEAGEATGPVEANRGGAPDDGADVFNNEAVDPIGMACGELVGVDAAQRVAEQVDGLMGRDVVGEGQDIAEVGFATAVFGVAAPAVATLIEGDDAMGWAQVLGEAGEIARAAEVAVKDDKNGTGTAEVEVGQGAVWAGQGVARGVIGLSFGHAV